MAVTPPPPLTENGAGLFSRCRAVRTVDVCVVPELLFTGVTKLVAAEGQKQHPSFQEWQYWLDRGLPKDARGSVSDKAGEVQEPEAAEVVARDLL